MLVIGNRVFSTSNRVGSQLEPLGKLVGNLPYYVNLTFNYLMRLHTLCFFLVVVGIHSGLTSELRQRVHTVSELTSAKRDYCLLVTEESLIDNDLSQVSSGKLFFLLIETELTYNELK